MGRRPYSHRRVFEPTRRVGRPLDAFARQEQCCQCCCSPSQARKRVVCCRASRIAPRTVPLYVRARLLRLLIRVTTAFHTDGSHVYSLQYESYLSMPSVKGRKGHSLCHGRARAMRRYGDSLLRFFARRTRAELQMGVRLQNAVHHRTVYAVSLIVIIRRPLSKGAHARNIISPDARGMNERPA